MKVATCTICRLENIYIKEFVDHYKALGVDHMYIYDNNLPNTENISDVLQSYIDNDFVTVINYQDQEKYPMGDALISAFTDCWETNKNEYDWILFLDNDEFLILQNDSNIKEYLGLECFNNIDVIRINWLCYDDNNFIYYQDKPLRKRFTHPCKDDPFKFDENKHTKSIIHNTAKNKEIIFDFGAAHNPLLFRNNSYNYDDYINNNIYSDNAGNILSMFDQSQHSINYINYDLAYYAHYRMKTIDEYVNNKIKKLTIQGYNSMEFSIHTFFKYNEYSIEKEKYFLDNTKKYSKNVVYTAIIGNYDTLNEIEYMTPGWDYICFTDNEKLTSNTWTIKYISDDDKEKFFKEYDYCWWWKNKNQYLNRYIKLNPHKYLPEYTFSIYIDGNIIIKNNLNDFLEEYINKIGNYDYILWTFTHTTRDCLYDEINKCIELKKDDAKNLERLYLLYKQEHVPHHLGMSHNCVLCRYHKEQDCTSLMNEWWEYVKEYSVRDQCSLYYVLMKQHKMQNVKLIMSKENSDKYFINKDIHNKYE